MISQNEPNFAFLYQIYRENWDPHFILAIGIMKCRHGQLSIMYFIDIPVLCYRYFMQLFINCGSNRWGKFIKIAITKYLCIHIRTCKAITECNEFATIYIPIHKNVELQKTPVIQQPLYVVLCMICKACVKINHPY
jgi:hypothetical protein